MSPDKDITITIARLDRYWVCQALIDLAIKLEAEVAALPKRARGRTHAQVTLRLAGNLRAIAAKVS